MGSTTGKVSDSERFPTINETDYRPIDLSSVDSDSFQNVPVAKRAEMLRDFSQFDVFNPQSNVCRDCSDHDGKVTISEFLREVDVNPREYFQDRYSASSNLPFARFRDKWGYEPDFKSGSFIQISSTQRKVVSLESQFQESKIGNVYLALGKLATGESDSQIQQDKIYSEFLAVYKNYESQGGLLDFSILQTGDDDLNYDCLGVLFRDDNRFVIKNEDDFDPEELALISPITDDLVDADSKVRRLTQLQQQANDKGNEELVADLIDQQVALSNSPELTARYLFILVYSLAYTQQIGACK